MNGSKNSLATVTPNTKTQLGRPGPTEEADPLSQLEENRSGKNKRN